MRRKGVASRLWSGIAFGAFLYCGVSGASAAEVEARAVDCSTNRSPVANAGADLQVYVGDVVTFDGRASYDPDGTAIARFAWTFANGLYGRDAVSTTTYSLPGTYNVTLTVMDACRARQTDTIVVTVYADDEDEDPCAGNLAPTASPGPNQTNRLVGDLVSFSGAGSSDSDGVIVSYHWDFGDGTSGLGSSVSHRYNLAGNYLVQLTVTDDCGATNRRSSYVSVVSACALNQPPTSNAGADRTALRGDTLSFDGSGSRDPEGQITAYQWLFGDGTSASGRLANKAYSAAGTYVVTLRVTDSCGLVGSDTATVTINDPEPNPDGLDASFEVSSNAPRIRENITFTSAMADNSAGLWFYWEFGDGVAGYGGATVTRSYANVGTYSAVLTVFRDGTWESATSAPETITVSPGMTLQGLVEGQFVYDVGVEIVNGYVWAVGSPGKFATVDVRNASPALLKVQSLAGTMYDVSTNGSLVAVAGGYGGVYLFNGADPVNHGLRGQLNTFNTDSFEAFGVGFSGNVMYVTGGWAGLRVVDVSSPASPRPITTITSAGSLRHVEVAGSRLYCSDPSLPGVRVFNITNPAAPTLMGSIRTTNTTTRLAANGNRLACVQGYRGIELLDVTNVNSPVFLARLLEGNPSYGVELTANRAYVGYLASVVEIDITNPQSPQVITSVPIGNQAGEVHMKDGKLYSGRWTGVVAVIQP